MAVVQVGETVEVGLGGLTYSNFVITGYQGPQRMADLREITDADAGETQTKIYTNPRKRVTISGVIKNDGSSTELAAIEALKPGDQVSLNTGGTAASRTDEEYTVEEAPNLERKGDGVEASITLEHNAALGLT